MITLLNFGSNAAVSKLKPNEMLKKMQEQVANRQKLRSHQVGLFMNNCLTEIRDADQIMKKHRSDNHLAQEKLIENIRNQTIKIVRNDFFGFFLIRFTYFFRQPQR